MPSALAGRFLSPAHQGSPTSPSVTLMAPSSSKLFPLKWRSQILVWMSLKPLTSTGNLLTDFSIFCCWCCSVIKSCLTLCDPMDCSTPGFPVPHHLLEFAQFMSIESVMPSNHLILCHPFLLLPSIFPSIMKDPVSQLFASGGQSIGASASASVLPMSTHG